MRTKQLFTNKVELLRNQVRQVSYLLNTNGTFEEVKEAFDKVYDTINNLDNLIDTEPDDFNTNQVIPR